MSRTSTVASDPAKKPERRTRGERLGFRLDHRTRLLVQRAAELEQRSLTDFCLTVLVEAAEATIQRHDTLALSRRDRDIFFDTLMNPPEPNERLRRAADAARTRVAT